MSIQKEEIKKEQTKALELSNNAEGQKITSKPKLDMAKELLSEIKDFKKSLKEKKESITKPMNEALKNIRGIFKPAEEKSDNAEFIIKGKISDYLVLLEAEAEKKKEEVEKKMKDGEMNLDQASRKMEKVESKTDDIKKRVLREIEIVDVNKIPREYLIPNIVAIRKDALDGKDISGVKVVEKIIIVS